MWLTTVRWTTWPRASTEAMIRFTVVTITYNAEAVLERTLQSVLRQTYGGVEHLIIDGASKDGTLQMAEAYKQASDQSECGHKVIIKSEPDRGIYDAMNKGLMQASGDYIVYMNAGDCFPQDDTLEQVVRRCRLSEYPSDGLPGVLYGLTDIVDGEGRYLRPMACWCVIRPSMPARISPRTCSMICTTASRPMWTGVSA